ncbi:MAG: alpha/beta fold hydrolase [Parachlamydiales bacterium]|nr:alpha/beta fold hydrolase [Candidatus Acheromyda pituitae]
MHFLILACLTALFFCQPLSQASMLQSANEQDFIVPEYTFSNGQKLSNLKIHYATLGKPKKNSAGVITNAVLMLHWSNGSGADLLSESFIAELYAPGKPLDANRYYLIFPDSIGHGMSSKPSDGLRSQFPHYGYHDMVNIQHLLVTQELKISHLKMVIGTSMGGMQTWLWTEKFPEFMDGAMPIVSLPQHVEGRNLIWRQAIAQAIKNDPAWDKGNYKQQPYSLAATWPFANMLLDGVPHLEKTIPDLAAALNFIDLAKAEAGKMDANDLIYVLEASADYKPEDRLGSIQAKVYALDFSDDQLDPAELGTLKDLIKRVKHGKAVIQPGTPDSFGHLTMAHPELWANHVASFIEYVDQD